MVDSVDGNTEKTALTIANTDIKLFKTGATTLANKNSGGGTHISNGLYSGVFDATDTNTLGPMKAYVHVAGSLPWEGTFIVLPANVYDSLVLGTDLLDISISQVAGDATAATTMLSQLKLPATGTVTNAGLTPTLTQFECTGSEVTDATANHYKGKQVYAITGNLARQYLGQVTAYSLVSARGRFTISQGSQAAEIVANGDTVIFL